MTAKRNAPSMPRFSFMSDGGGEIDMDATPTPERMRHANDNYASVAGSVRMQDAPIDRLCRACLLDPTPSINAILYDAAMKYLSDFRSSSMDQLRAVDYSRQPGHGPVEQNDRAALAGRRWHEARDLIGPYFSSVIDPVVIHETAFETVGRSLRVGNASQARAVAKDRLRGGLHMLAVHYGLLRS